MEGAPFYREALDRSAGHLSKREALSKLLNLLKSKELEDEIRSGNVTLAIIRPAVGPEANIEGLSDLDAAKRIEEMIFELGILAKFSCPLTRKDVIDFYGDAPRKSMLNEPPVDSDTYKTRWAEFVDFMISGPSTFFLLYSPDGDAVGKWRAHLGHWNIDKNRDINTIRGALGVNKYNNLVHGSDAPESVLRELNIIGQSLKSHLSKTR